MFKRRFFAFVVIVLAVLVGYFVYSTENPESKFAFKLGLDLNGGTHLVYEADTSNLTSDANQAMSALRDVVERRVNIFGVSEPIVQIEKAGFFNEEGTDRLIVELPGVTDTNQAIEMIGKTPLLEFRLMNEFPNATEEELSQKSFDELFAYTGLTGQYLSKATIQLDRYTNQPTVLLDFNSEGKKLFADITKNNVGRNLAIFLDGSPISIPVIREEIKDGSAEISGNFTLDEAKTLVRDLNYGALPVPINLISTETIGATLGEEATKAGAVAGMYALAMIIIFLIIWYRLPGVLASLALLSYVVINLAVFKLIPVTLTAAGIAGFVLSIGMAVDASILIFERMKEEIAKGHKLEDAVKAGFARAWLSIRDSNISSIITAVILFGFASSSVVKGFALVFMIGVILSMLSALTISRTLLFAFRMSDGKFSRFLFLNGLKK